MGDATHLRGVPPAAGTNQMSLSVRLSPRSGVVTTQAIHRPSGDGWGSLKRWREAKSSKVSGCDAVSAESTIADTNPDRIARNIIGPVNRSFRGEANRGLGPPARVDIYLISPGHPTDSPCPGGR